MPYPYFLDLRQAALHQNVSELIDLLHKGACIDEQQGFMTPAADLASEGHCEAATFLVEYGASADMAAYGAASAGDLEYALFLRAHCGASLNQIARGAEMAELPMATLEALEAQGADLGVMLRSACRRGNRERASYWRERGRRYATYQSELGVRQLYGDMLLGAGMAGDKDYRDQLLVELTQSLGTPLADDDPFLAQMLFFSAAKDSEEFRDTFALRPASQKIEIALGAMVSRQFRYINELLEAAQPEPEEFFSLLKQAVEVMLTFGNYSAIARLLTKYQGTLQKPDMKPSYVAEGNLGLLMGMQPQWAQELAALTAIPRPLSDEKIRLKTGQLTVMYKYKLTSEEALVWGKLWQWIFIKVPGVSRHNQDIHLNILKFLAPFTVIELSSIVQRIAKRYPGKFGFFADSAAFSPVAVMPQIREEATEIKDSAPPI